jgi:hypothetical protein
MQVSIRRGGCALRRWVSNEITAGFRRGRQPRFRAVAARPTSGCVPEDPAVEEAILRITHESRQMDRAGCEARPRPARRHKSSRSDVPCCRLGWWYRSEDRRCRQGTRSQATVCPDGSFKFRVKNGRRSLTMTIKKLNFLVSLGTHVLHIHGTRSGRDMEAADAPIWTIKHNRVRLIQTGQRKPS